MDILKNKRVAVVGNAESLKSQYLNNYIDSHDIVVRFNRGAEVTRPEEYGLKTDISVFDTIYKDYKFAKLDTIVAVSKDFTRYYRYVKYYYLYHLKKEIPGRRFKRPMMNVDKFFDRVIWLPLTNDIETIDSLNHPIPSTGALWLNYLQHYKCKEVNIFGFDFKKTKTYYEDYPARKEVHNFELEKEFILNLVKKNNWSIR